MISGNNFYSADYNSHSRYHIYMTAKSQLTSGNSVVIIKVFAIMICVLID